MQQVKGAVLKSRLAFIEQHAGADGTARVLAALSAEDQREFRMILTVKWYPFELGKRLDDAIVEVLGGGQPTFFIRLGESSAEQNLSTLHRGFLTPGKPHAFLAKAGTIYALYYETGRREYEQLGDKEGVLTTYDAETFSAPDCLTVMGWYRKALEMCGASNVKIQEEECRAKGGAVCRYRVSWS
ncbi:MAG: TIGR02265 family protein [Gemmatimonadota bacterium]